MCTTLCSDRGIQVSSKVNNELLRGLAGLTCWRVQRDEDDWMKNVLAPRFSQIYSNGAYLPPRIVAELAVLDAATKPVQRKPTPLPESDAWRACLALLHEKVRRFKQLNVQSNAVSGLGARLTRSLVRRLRMEDRLAPAQKSRDPNKLLKRHLDYLQRVADKSSGRSLPKDEQAVEDFVAKRLAAKGSLQRLLGPSFCGCLPREYAPDYSDPVLTKLLESNRPIAGTAPNTTATHVGGDLPRAVRSVTGVFKEWSEGPLPPNLKIHPLCWMYKDVAPKFFLYMAANGQLRQPYGAESEPSNRCAYILVDIDLMESEAMHRFKRGAGQPPLISYSRALLCSTIHRLALRSEEFGFRVAFRLKRWALGAATSTQWRRNLISDAETAAFIESPRAVHDWLTFHMPEFVLTRMIEEPSRLRQAEEIGNADHHARLVIGEIPPQQRFQIETDRRIASPSSIGLRLQLLSPTSFRYGFGIPNSLLTAQLIDDASFDSLDQVAHFATEGCLSTSPAEIVHHDQLKPGGVVS